jgi:omega-hydroxy-beta-dihydromenaquinone-9 sulfotransferase
MRPTDSPPRRTKSTPQIWLGYDVVAWLRLLARNRFAVHPSRWHLVLILSAASVANTLWGLVQRAAYGRRIRATPVPTAPLFVLGHWRTGTTLLHELLAQDPRLAAPTTYECLCPHHFLVTRSWLPRLFGWMMPSRRPMDNVAAGFDRPQEDEFALCLLGQPSPYERIAFPNRPAAGAGALDMSGLAPPARRRWKAAFYRFIQALTVAHPGRRLVLKSPPHTCRIPTLLELFPDARFIHIVRDPYAVYPSTLHLWRVTYGINGLQKPSWAELPDYILDTFLTVYDRLEEGRRLIPPGRLHELRYEELVRDPIGQLEAAYRGLELGDFGAARPHVDAYLASVSGYETNRHLLTPVECREVTRRWRAVIRRYGYPVRDE